MSERKPRLKYRIPVVTLLVVGMLSLFTGLAYAAAYNSGDKVTTTGSNTMSWTGQGADNGVLNTELCGARDTPDGNANTPYLLWIFTTDHGTADTVKLHLGGSGSGDYDPATASGSSFHFFTPYFVPDSNLTANVTFNTLTTGNGAWILTISHGCTGTQQSAISSVTTKVHDAQHNDITGSAVDLGSTVHDSATLSSTPAITSLPSGSSVTFYFYKDGHCDSSDEGIPGTSDDSGSVDVSGKNTTGGYAIDDALPEGPLTAGDYSYRAFFTSGNHTLIGDATGECEPFSVKQAETNTSTSVVRDDTSAVLAADPIPHLPLGTSVHDTATVGTQVGSIVISGTVTYHFYNSIDCKSNEITSLNSKTWPQAKTIDSLGSVPDSQSTGALGAGDYGFQAVYSGDNNYKGSTGACEPFVIDKGTLQISTDIHNANHVIVTSVDAGAIVHDTATLSGATSGFTPDYSKVSFTLDSTGTSCQNGVAVANTGTELVNGVTLARSANSSALTPGDYSYNASFAGDANYNPAGPATCEPLHVFKAALTPGYWKTHLALNGAGCTGLPSGTGCSSNGPFTKTYLPQTLGAYSVGSIQQAAGIFTAMTCSFSGNAANQNQQAIGCLAGHLLAAKLNVANGANTCIIPTIAKADAFLTNPPATTVTFGSNSATSINYQGLSLSYTGITLAQRNLAIALKSAFDKYNNGGGC